MGAGLSRTQSRSDEPDVASSSDWSVENPQCETAACSAAADSSTKAPAQTQQNNTSKEADDKKAKTKKEYEKICVDDVWLEVDHTVVSNPPPLKQETERTGWHTVRIFVSSTFRDFHSERDVLVKKVY